MGWKCCYWHLVSKNYEILEEIGKSETSIVYLALCKRGRLRDRKVALKRVIVLLILCDSVKWLPIPWHSDSATASAFNLCSYFFRIVSFDTSSSPSSCCCLIVLHIYDWIILLSCYGAMFSGNSIWFSAYSQPSSSLRGWTSRISQDLGWRFGILEEGACTSSEYSGREFVDGGWLPSCRLFLVEVHKNSQWFLETVELLSCDTPSAVNTCHL